MRPRRLSEIARDLGVSDRPGMGDVLVTGVTTDTRELAPGQIYVALRGPRFDGGDFIDEALRAGAVAAVSDRTRPGPVFTVPDPLAALLRLADVERRAFRGPVVAITGSAGKTTTKDLAAAVLSARFRVHASRDSFNNRIGVSRTILDAPPDAEVLVLEIGTNARGEIAELARLCRPTHAVLTNVGPSHLLGLGSVEGVLAEKLDLADGVRPGGAVLLNRDDSLLSRAVLPEGLRRVTYGFHPESDIRGVERLVTDRSVGFRFADGGMGIAAALIGAHNASNLLAAAATGRLLGLSDAEIRAGAAEVAGRALRMEEVDAEGAVLLADCYNANPLSVGAALDELARRRPRGRRVFIFGDMLELGEEAGNRHVDVGRRVASSEIDLFVCVGPLAAIAGREAVKAGMDPAAIRQFPDASAARDAGILPARRGDVVLIKGSRGMGLERILGASRNGAAAAAVRAGQAAP